MLRKFIFFAAVGSAAVPAVSEAATMLAVYSGRVSNSYDLTGLFRLGAGTSLGGLPYTLTYTYDTGRGVRFADDASDEIYGGAGYGVASPMISAVLTIGGAAQPVLGTGLAYARQLGGAEYQYFDHYAQDDVEDLQAGVVSQNYAYQWGYDYSTGLPVDLDVPFALEGLAATGAAGGYFGFFTYDFVEGRYTTYAYGNLYPDRLSVSAIAPATVPLPAGAGLLFVALVGLGAAPAVLTLRRALPHLKPPARVGKDEG